MGRNKYTSKANTKNVLLVKHLEAGRFSDNYVREVKEYQSWIFDITDDFSNIEPETLISALEELGLW